MATQRRSNGWERWRGGVDQQLADVGAALERIEAKLEALPALKVKIALAFGGAGIVLAAVADVAVHKLLG